MTSNPKRQWFRFHLLTAVLMLFAAGGFVWPNVQEHRIIPEWADNEPARIFGWPVTAVTFYSAFAMRTSDDVPEISYRGLLVDAVSALGLLFTVALISEYLIRRRETRKA